jgi:DNA integrity scanning protein DisA with diadenylate cyclase activity
MAAVHDVPDVTGKKMAIGARHRLCLRIVFQPKKRVLSLSATLFMQSYVV